MSFSSAVPSFRPAESRLHLAPGFHFVPTDDELVVYYLRPRLANANHRLPLPIFVNERILNYHPDTLIEKYRQYGEGRWFFFTAREPKHLGGNRPNRTTPDNGHWNATGSIRPIRSAGKVLVGCRRTLVFYEASRSGKKKNRQAGLLPPAEEEEGGGQADKAKDGVKTEWTMYEYESLSSEAEFEAIRAGNANKMGALVLCTIQNKKHHQEGGETTTTKKSTKRKTKEEVLELEAVPAAAGDVAQGSRAGTTDQGQDEDGVQRALMEAAAAAEPLPELAYHGAPGPAAAGNFNVDPNQNMPCYYLTNSSSPAPAPPQETLMAPASEDNHIVMHQQNNYFINQSMNMNMKNSQSSFHVQETPPQVLPYLDTKMATPLGGGTTMNHMLQNRFFNMTPSQAPPVPDVWERSAELPGDKPNRHRHRHRPLLKSEDAWCISHHPAKLPGRGLNSPYVTSNNLSFVPTPQQESVMSLASVMHQRNYFNHSMNMGNSQFHVPQDEFLPYSSTNMAAPLGGGSSAVDHHMLQNRIFNGYGGQGLSNSIFGGHGGGEYGHLISTIMEHPGPSRFSFPPQQSQGPLLSNQVSLNHQNPAASMVGYDQRNGGDLPPKIV